MANINDCIGKRIKISTNSITIKTEEGKTCGVVRNITSVYDLQANKKMEYHQKFKKLGLHGKVNIKECIIHDGNLYVFRNISNKLFHEKYGFFNDEEKQRLEESEQLYNEIKEVGIEIIECIFI